jgi:alpha-amylase/alpha-mannosidase (GH57 family)
LDNINFARPIPYNLVAGQWNGLYLLGNGNHRMHHVNINSADVGIYLSANTLSLVPTPDEMPTLEDRMRSRFKSGLIQDISTPDIEMWTAILQKKANLENYRLSDDLAFRFSNKGWKEHPLSSEKYLKWCETATLKGPLINLFMDFETFGEHQWADTGIFDFFEHFVHLWCKDSHNDFLTLEEASDMLPSMGEISMPETVTWADTERDLTAWNGNEMQQEALKDIYDIMPKNLVGDEKLIDDWRRLQTSDHFYYMCTKYFHDGDVHAYFSCYESPYFAYLYWANAIRDLKTRIELAKIEAGSTTKTKKASPTKPATKSTKPKKA